MACYHEVTIAASVDRGDCLTPWITGQAGGGLIACGERKILSLCVSAARNRILLCLRTDDPKGASARSLSWVYNAVPPHRLNAGWHGALGETGSAERILGRSIRCLNIVGPGTEAAGVIDPRLALFRLLWSPASVRLRIRD